jgi:hypothetical protein
LKIEEFVREVRAEASKRSYIRRVEIVEEGLSPGRALPAGYVHRVGSCFPLFSLVSGRYPFPLFI